MINVLMIKRDITYRLLKSQNEAQGVIMADVGGAEASRARSYQASKG